jgi:flavorubredoxin
MQADHGTTYNAFLVQGEKTAVIETSKNRFATEYLDNLRYLVDLKKIDYVILNHMEPDHSGSLAKLLAETPQAQVVVSRTGEHFVKNILNRDVQPMKVGDGDSLDLGGKTLQFIHAPFLHWPDSMFTFIPEDGILMPCDFLGSHYCDDRLFDDLVDNFALSFRYYYQAIFRPFKPYVLSAIAKLQGLDIKMVCPSHGPMLRTNPQSYIGKYEVWSQLPSHGQDKNLMIFYASAYGNTAKMAEEIARGAARPGLKVSLHDVLGAKIGILMDQIEVSDGILVGSPTINGDAVEPIWQLLSSLATLPLKGKIGGSFGSFGWSGEASKMIEDRLRSLKFKVPEAAVRATLVPTEADLAACREYGAKIAAAIIS